MNRELYEKIKNIVYSSGNEMYESECKRLTDDLYEELKLFKQALNDNKEEIQGRNKSRTEFIKNGNRTRR